MSHLSRQAAVLVLLSTLLCGVPAIARTADEAHLAGLADGTASLRQALEVLQSKPQASWTPEEIDAYLSWALNVVFYAEMVECDLTGRMPLDPNDIAHHNVVQRIPGNPFNNFEPMKFLGPADAFSPGDLVIQVAPQEHWSGIFDPQPWSFVISIYGESIDTPPVKVLNLASLPWAVQPTGARVTTMRYRTSTAKRMEMIRQAEEKRAAEAAATE